MLHAVKFESDWIIITYAKCKIKIIKKIIKYNEFPGSIACQTLKFNCREKFQRTKNIFKFNTKCHIKYHNESFNEIV